MKVVKDRKDIRPLLVNFGFVLAVSLAGFLYSRLKPRTKMSRPPHSPRSAEHGSEVDVGGGTGMSGDHHTMKRTPDGSGIASISPEVNEDKCMVKVAVDSSISPSRKQSADKDGLFFPEFNDLVKEFDFTVGPAVASPTKDVNTAEPDVEMSRAFANAERDYYEQEITHLKNMVGMLQEREMNLEDQLLEYYGIKEQESTVLELQNRLKINNMEFKLLTLKIESLQEDKRKLQAKLADHEKTVAELDAARAKINLLKKKLRTEAEQNKEQILALKGRVSRLQEQDLKELKATTTDSEIQVKLQRLKDLEDEVEELRKSNSNLHLENSELACRLESTQSALKESEIQALREQSNRLRQENEDLAKRIEQLQADRCIDVEELVYLRWINACLRYELRNFQPPHGKTAARDLSKSLSPKSEEKAKQLILEYANTEETGENGINIMDFEPDHWLSSRAYYFADTGVFDESSQSSKTSSSSKMRIFAKLRRLILGKDIHHDHHGSSEGKSVEDFDSPRGGFSISTVTSDHHSSSAQTPSLDSTGYSLRPLSRHSMDMQRLRSTKMDDPRDAENIRISSDVGSYYRRHRFSSTGGDLSFENQLDQDLYPCQKSKLVKFADALKDSGEETRNRHRKAASFGSFETFRRSGSR